MITKITLGVGEHISHPKVYIEHIDLKRKVCEFLKVLVLCKDQMKLQWRATSIVESNILHEHANGSHNMWIWVFFYLWAKDQEEKEHQHDFTGIKLRGEVLWLLSQISNGSTDIFPVHMKVFATNRNFQKHKFALVGRHARMIFG